MPTGSLLFTDNLLLSQINNTRIADQPLSSVEKLLEEELTTRLLIYRMPVSLPVPSLSTIFQSQDSRIGKRPSVEGTPTISIKAAPSLDENKGELAIAKEQPGEITEGLTELAQAPLCNGHASQEESPVYCPSKKRTLEELPLQVRKRSRFQRGLATRQHRPGPNRVGIFMLA